jgi:carbonic anhydrase
MCLSCAGQPAPNAIGADAALSRLMKGNVRYVANRPTHRDLSAGRAERAKSQYPIAAVLSCSDSRVAPEFVFDQGPGDLFIVRVAGNFVNEDGLASLEYAVKFLGVPLVIVLGHSNCGAVDAAIKVIEENASLPGHLPGLVQSIKPAVEAAKLKAPEDLLIAAITENVALNVRRLQTAQPLLASFAQTNGFKIVGGVYDLATGNIGVLS